MFRRQPSVGSPPVPAYIVQIRRRKVKLALKEEVYPEMRRADVGTVMVG
jgi:hypothetical protein